MIEVKNREQPVLSPDGGNRTEGEEENGEWQHMPGDAARHNSTFMGRKSWESNSRPEHGMEGPRDPGGGTPGRVLTRGMGQREQVYGANMANCGGKVNEKNGTEGRGSKPLRNVDCARPTGRGPACHRSFGRGLRRGGDGGITALSAASASACAG